MSGPGSATDGVSGGAGRSIFRGHSLQNALRAAAAFDQGVDFFDRNAAIETLPYGELTEQASRIAFALRARGVSPGDRVALVLGTSPELVAAIFGVLFARGVVLCLPTPRLGRAPNYQELTGGMVRAAGARLVISDERTNSQFAASPDMPPGTVFVTVEQLLAESAGSLAEESGASDWAMVQFSSGTTGNPKPIVLTHGNITSNCAAILETFPGSIAEHRGCSWLPLHHDMGLIGGLFSAVVGQGSITLLRPEDFAMRPLLWLRAISATRATVSPAPNFAMQMCVDRRKPRDMQGLDLSSWSIALIGAEHVRAVTLRRFHEVFQEHRFRYEAFTPVYGLAEATLAVSFSDIAAAPTTVLLDPEALGRGEVVPLLEVDPPTADRAEAMGEPVQLTSVGRPIGDISIEIRDSDGARLPADRVGAIHVRGSSVMGGYLDPDLAESVADGWLDTGDLGFLHQGELYIYGRTRDILILNGRNVDPHLVEATLELLPGLQAERVAAIPVEVPGQGSESFAVLAERAKESTAEALGALADTARERIISGTGLVPTAVHIVELGRLPRTTSGKVKRGETGRQFRSGDLPVLASAGVRGDA